MDGAPLLNSSSALSYYSGGRSQTSKETDMASKKWIKGAVKKPGALRKELGVPEGKKIPAAKLAKAAKAGGKLGQRARFAQELKRFSRGK
jgi:hypothetical protein